jgi:hypothetical protein
MRYFIFSICLSAFLLFLVEPLVGKVLLPWFGGTSAVWSTCMLFFQVLLTGGYAYAAWSSRQTRSRGKLHLALLGLSLILLAGLGLAWRSPLTPADGLRPGASTPPVPQILLLLAITVGLPFFLLASNSTLVQNWFARTFPNRSPYRLYALSNLGSLAALVCYPLLVEPNLVLTAQGWIWSAGYLLFAGLAVYLTLRAMHLPDEEIRASTPPIGFNHQGSKTQRKRIKQVRSLATSRLRSPRFRPSSENTAPAGRNILAWLALSACPSILFLATTGYLTQQVAVIPFLWVLPLAIYLLTYALAFSGVRWYNRLVFICIFIVIILLYDWAMTNGPLLGVPWQVAIFSLVLLVCCLIAHAELYRRRPGPEHMPAFYLTTSAGGALGGLLVAFIAPLLFKGFWELPLGMLLFCLLFLAVGREPRKAGLQGEIAANLSLLLLGLSVLISGVRAVYFIDGDLRKALTSVRNFYGVVRVLQSGSPDQADYSCHLVHGNTIHGIQMLDPAHRDTPTAYYGPSGGAGLALLNHPRTGAGLRVGALGLGVGTIAAYGQPGDVYRFYEINPQVIQLAEGQGGYFSFLKDSKAAVEIVPGDARLSLESELDAGQTQAYDVLVLDVFSNDSVPVHLLDEQAFAVYLQFLRPDGVLAVHITNGYLDLVPVVWSLAEHYNMAQAVIDDPGDGIYTSPSTWVLLSRDPAALSAPAIAARARPMEGYTTSLRLWTDEYSNLFQILKR